MIRHNAGPFLKLFIQAGTDLEGPFSFSLLAMVQHDSRAVSRGAGRFDARPIQTVLGQINLKQELVARRFPQDSVGPSVEQDQMMICCWHLVI